MIGNKHYAGLLDEVFETLHPQPAAGQYEERACKPSDKSVGGSALRCKGQNEPDRREGQCEEQCYPSRKQHGAAFVG